ncbi:MAG: hypothetical protein MZW92_20450 [Comamonadaceae bacterium]|nr:hypothetical protein [Comamonadaceae bacterium]
MKLQELAQKLELKPVTAAFDRGGQRRLHLRHGERRDRQRQGGRTCS